MASPAVASRRRSRFFFRARAFLPDIASKEWRVSCARRVRVVVRRGFPEKCVTTISQLLSGAQECLRPERLLRRREGVRRHFAARTPRVPSRGMPARWSRCHVAAAVDAHAGSVKSVASGSWACSAISVSHPERARSQSNPTCDDDPVFATAGMDGSTRVWGLARRDNQAGADSNHAAVSQRVNSTQVGHEFPYTATCVDTLEGHTSGVRAVAMPPLPNGWEATRSERSIIATGSYDGTARLWHCGWETRHKASSASGVSLGNHGYAVLCAAFAPDATKMVTGSGDGRVRVWDCSRDVFSPDDDNAKKPNKNINPLASLDTQFGAVRCVATGDEGNSPLCATGGEDGTVRVWSWVASFEEKGDARDDDGALTCELMLKGHAGAITDLALCPPRGTADTTNQNQKGNPFLIAAGGDAGSLGVWVGSFNSPQERRETRSVNLSRLAVSAKAHAFGAVRGCLCLGLDSTTLATSSEDKTVRLWNLQNGTCLCVLVGAASATESVSFSLNDGGVFLAVGIADGTLFVWKQGEYEHDEDDDRDDDVFRVASSSNSSPTSRLKRVSGEIEQRLTLGLRNLLSPPSRLRKPENADFSDAGEVSAACFASADHSAQVDAEAFLPRIDRETAVLVKHTVGKHGTVWNEGGNPEVLCAICHCPVEIVENEKGNETNEWCMPLPCGHVFHARSCVLPWITENETSCPLCRKRVVSGGGDVPVACLWTSR